MATITVPSLEDVILQRMQGRTRGGLMDDPEYMHRAELEETLLLNQQANKDKPIPEIPSADVTQGLFGIGSEAVKTGLNLGSRALELGERIAAPIVDLQRRTGERERSVLSDVTFQNNLPTYVDAFLPTLSALGSTALGGVQSISNYLNRVGADIARRGPLPEGGREDITALQPSDVRDIPRIQQQYTYQPRTDVGRFMTEVPQIPFHLVTRASELVEDAVSALGVSPERSRAIGAAAEIAALYFADKAFRGTVRSIGKDVRELNGYLRDASIDNAYQSAQKILTKTNQEELAAARTRLTQTLRNISESEQAGMREVESGLQTLAPEEITPTPQRARFSELISNQIDILVDPNRTPNEIAEASRRILRARNIDTLDKVEPGLRSLGFSENMIRNIGPTIYETLARDLNVSAPPFTTRGQRQVRNQALTGEAVDITPQQLATRIMDADIPALTKLESLRELRTRIDETGLPIEDALINMGFDLPTIDRLSRQLNDIMPLDRPPREPPSEPLPVESTPPPVEPTPPTVTPEPRPLPPSETALDILADPSASPAAQNRALSEIKRMALDAAPGKLAEGLRILGLDESLLPRLRNVRAAKAPATPRTIVGDVISTPPSEPRATSLRELLTNATRDVPIGGEIITSPDPVARSIVNSSDFRALETALTQYKPTQIIGGGVGSVIVDIGEGRVLRVGVGPNAPWPGINEVIRPEASGQIGQLRWQVMPRVETGGITAADVAQMEAALTKKGYEFVDAGIDNLGKLPNGRLVVIDPGAVVKSSEPAPVVSPRRAPQRKIIPTEVTPDERIVLDEAFRMLADPNVKGTNRRDFVENVRGIAERYGVNPSDLPDITPEQLQLLTTARRTRQTQIPEESTDPAYREYLRREITRRGEAQPDLIMGEELRKRGVELTESEFNIMRAEVNALERSPQVYRDYLTEYLSRSTSTPPKRDYIQVTSLRDLTTGTPGEFSRTAPVQVLREDGKPTSVIINENTLNTKSLPQVQAETVRLEQAGASERVKQINVMEQAKINAKAELFGISPEEASRINGVELRNRLIKLAADNNLDMYKVTREGLEQIPRNVVETSAKLNDGDLSSPKKVTQEDRAQYMAHEANERSPFTFDEIMSNLVEGIDISSQLPPQLAELYGRALQYNLSQLETPDRRSVGQILRSIKNLVNNERGAIGNIELTPQQKQAYDELRNDAIRLGRDITRLIRGDPRLSTVEKRLFEEYARSTKAPPPKPYLVLNDMAFDSEASLRGDFVIKRSAGEVEGTFNPEIYYSDWLGVAAPDDMVAPEARTNFQKVTRPESIQTATRKLLNDGQDAIVHAYRGVEQNLIKDRADYMRAIKRIRRTFNEEQQRAIGADLFLNEGSIDLLIESNVEPRALNSKEITGAQFVRSVFEELLPRIQDVRKNTGRGPMDVVPDYITHMRASNKANAFGTETSVASDAANVISERYANLKNTLFPFERTRRGGKFPAEMNAFDILETYVDYALRQIHMGPFVAKIHELIDTPIIDPSTNKTWDMKSEKPNRYKYMKDWNNYIAGKPQESIPEPWNKLLFATSRSLGNAYIAGNPLSAIIQPTSLFNTQMKVGLGRTIQASLNYMADLVNPRHPLRKFRLENSKSLDVRNPDIFFDEAGAGIIETLLENTPYLRPLGRAATKISGAVGNYGTKPLRWLDQISAEITWDAGYEFAKRAGKTGEDAFNVADDIVTLTQGSALRGERSPLQRTQKGRALTQFQTFAINNYDFLTNEVLGIDNKNMTNAQSVRNVMKLIGTGTLLNILVEDVGSGTSPIPNPPLAFLRTLMNGPAEGQTEGQYLAELVFGSTLGEVIKVVPLASSIRSQKGQLGGPVASFITDLGRAALGQKGTNLGRTITRSLIPGGLQLDKALLAPEKENTKSFRTLERRGNRDNPR